MAKQILTAILGHADLVKQRTHLAKGAMFLPEPEPLPEPFAEITLRVENASGQAVELDARVLQILEGRGIAVSFDDLSGAKTKLAPLFDSAVAGEDDEATFIFWGRSDPVSKRAASRRPSKGPSKSPSSKAPGLEMDPALDFGASTGPPPGMDVVTIPKIPIAAVGAALASSEPESAPFDTIPKMQVAAPVVSAPRAAPRIARMTPAVAFAPPAAVKAVGASAAAAEDRTLPGVAPAPEAPAPLQADEPKALEKSETATLEDQLATMSVNQKMQLAMRGDLAARALLLKDPNKNIHSFILQNPRITIDEVKHLAAYRQATADVLNAIASHREWTQNPGVVAALVRNPKTPGATAVRMMEKLPMAEIRRLAKANDAPPAVMAAARKKVADPGARG